MLMSIGGLVPLPSDALVTPVTFRVRKRNLLGILADLDAMENGKRELRGEWVVGRKTWQRMQTEWKASNKSNPTSPQPNNDPSSWDTSSGSTKMDSKRKERVVLYIHGGALTYCLISMGLFPNVVFSRCILPVKRGCTADDFHSISHVYRCARFW